MVRTLHHQLGQICLHRLSIISDPLGITLWKSLWVTQQRKCLKHCKRINEVTSMWSEMLGSMDCKKSHTSSLFQFFILSKAFWISLLLRRRKLLQDVVVWLPSLADDGESWFEEKPFLIDLMPGNCSIDDVEIRSCADVGRVGSLEDELLSLIWENRLSWWRTIDSVS